MSVGIVVEGTLPGADGGEPSRFTVQFATIEQARVFDELLHAAIEDAAPGPGRDRADGNTA